MSDDSLDDSGKLCLSSPDTCAPESLVLPRCTSDVQPSCQYHEYFWARYDVGYQLLADTAAVTECHLKTGSGIPCGATYLVLSGVLVVAINPAP